MSSRQNHPGRPWSVRKLTVLCLGASLLAVVVGCGGGDSVGERPASTSTTASTTTTTTTTTTTSTTSTTVATTTTAAPTTTSPPAPYSVVDITDGDPGIPCDVPPASGSSPYYTRDLLPAGQSLFQQCFLDNGEELLIHLGYDDIGGGYRAWNGSMGVVVVDSQLSPLFSADLEEVASSMVESIVNLPEIQAAEDIGAIEPTGASYRSDGVVTIQFNFDPGIGFRLNR